VHRLDQETSGILLLARDRQTHRQLSRQFQQRQVHKVYEAVLSGNNRSGTIELPLWADPQDRPKSIGSAVNQLDLLSGDSEGCDWTRVEFIRSTGFTLLMREDLIPIFGRRSPWMPQLQFVTFARKELCFEHPQSGQTSIYEQRRHFDESLHQLRQIVYSTLSQLREQTPEFRDCKH